MSPVAGASPHRYSDNLKIRRHLVVLLLQELTHQSQLQIIYPRMVHRLIEATKLNLLT